LCQRVENDIAQRAGLATGGCLATSLVASVRFGLNQIMILVAPHRFEWFDHSTEMNARAIFDYHRIER
jgi:hypothetical protein